MRVVRAIEEAWSEDGVLVLMDLGSAVLSAEMALDLLPEERRGRVLLSEAPLVEGAVAAAVAAGRGATLEEAAEEARGGLAAKSAHLAPRRAPPSAPNGSPSGVRAAPPPRGPTVGLTVRNRLGLHARPAALFVRTAAGFDADVTVSNVTDGRGPVSARSLNAVATLGVRHGHEILVQATGPQAKEALAAIRRLADDDFGDPPQTVTQSGVRAAADRALPAAELAALLPASSISARAGERVQRPASASPPARGTILQGLPASPGIAVGAARWLRATPLEVPDAPSADPAAELEALERALVAAGDEIRRARQSIAGRAGDYEAAIFDAHLLFLDDEALLVPARAEIGGECKNAARAWADAVAAAAAEWEILDDPYQRARVADLRAVGEQVLRHLLHLPPVLDVGATGIVVAPDLTPAEIVRLDRSRVLGVACAFGGPTSHLAILAGALGLPAVVGAGEALLDVREGTVLALDGEAGTIILDPPAAALRTADERRATWGRERAEALERAPLPAVTRDGLLIGVAANVATMEDIQAAVAAGADGVGLLRTEFLFLVADHMPGEDEQEQAYRTAAEALGGRPLTIRTLDVGADKQLPSVSSAHEQNPSLGLRGIRLGLSRPELLATQLRAVLRVAADHPVRVMLPMVTSVDEVRQARELLQDAREHLVAAGAPVPEHIEVGIMVEVPAAALTVEAFVCHVDFFSLGTNDLAQYVCAADRGNARVAALADALHPAVLRLIDRVARAARAGGRRAGVCGEVAGDPLAVPLLLGLGVGDLSMAPARIPAAKQAVRATDVRSARRLAQEALAARSAAEVRLLCRRCSLE